MIPTPTSIHLRYCGERPPKPVTEPPQGAEGGVAPRSTSFFKLVCSLAVMLQKSFLLSSLYRLSGCIRGCVRRWLRSAQPCSVRLHTPDQLCIALGRGT